ncbi:DsbA family protein [uncultured Paraglaciecola sp.]|uniref:DsbA family protein n=1 Tax=uncultured Paraglaciecola sp. TaxID=1765024 RepID=UPI0026318BD9|nr:DsbA family protein [uncultured Paraglaciecola sp.]
MKKHLISYITNMILSDKRLNKKRARIENKRIKQGLPHTLEVFLAIDDPASYLLLQVLPELQQRYAVRYAFKIVLEKQSSMFPELALWRANVLSDNQKLAALYQLTSPTQAIEDPELSKLASCQLVAMADSDDFITHALVLFHAFWNDDSTTVGSLIEPKVKDNLGALQKCLRDNQAELAHKGHYLSGIIYYGQEWYWGLERLQYLEQRLNELLIAGASVKQVSYNKLHQLCLPLAENWQAPNPKQAEPLTIYFSVRSPYSYLGLWRARKLAEHYQIPLKLKPVLPMLMRNLPVPKQKSMYIAHDTKREANEYALPFGKIADPLGAGVERCYALFDYAQSQCKEVEFMCNFTQAVWSQRVWADTDKGLKSIVERSGLDWQQAKQCLTDETWRHWAQANLKELYSLGLWGVPSFKYQNTAVFGQDKLAFIEQQIRQSLV